MALFDSARSFIRRSKEEEPEPDGHKTRYLVSTSGHPNYGDELIARAWLDYLAEREPDSDVWLDCPHPGRAAHLFADSHPRLRTTDTLWELALGSPSHDPIDDADRIRRLIRELGSPRFDPGLLALRDVASVHLLGGGYLNEMWHDNLGLVTAVAELRRAFEVRAFATGQGFMPLPDALSAWLAGELSVFDHVETRDAESTKAVGAAETGTDDAFLALALRRPVFDERASPDRIVLVQGDLRAWEDDAAIASIRSFTAAAEDADIGFVEAIPPDDLCYLAETRPGARVYPFGHIWHDGLPARSGQQWLTTRFHTHLLAAAAGAVGTVISGRPGYYDVKHASLLALGTGWTLVEAGADLASDDARPAVDPGFPDRAKELAARKRHLADRLYGPGD